MGTFENIYLAHLKSGLYLKSSSSIAKKLIQRPLRSKLILNSFNNALANLL